MCGAFCYHLDVLWQKPTHHCNKGTITFCSSSGLRHCFGTPGVSCVHSELPSVLSFKSDQQGYFLNQYWHSFQTASLHSPPIFRHWTARQTEGARLLAQTVRGWEDSERFQVWTYLMREIIRNESKSPSTLVFLECGFLSYLLHSVEN